MLATIATIGLITGVVCFLLAFIIESSNANTFDEYGPVGFLGGMAILLIIFSSIVLYI